MAHVKCFSASSVRPSIQWKDKSLSSSHKLSIHLRMESLNLRRETFRNERHRSSCKAETFCSLCNQQLASLAHCVIQFVDFPTPLPSQRRSFRPKGEKSTQFRCLPRNCTKKKHISLVQSQNGFIKIKTKTSSPISCHKSKLRRSGGASLNRLKNT